MKKTERRTLICIVTCMLVLCDWLWLARGTKGRVQSPVPPSSGSWLSHITQRAMLWFCLLGQCYWTCALERVLGRVRELCCGESACSMRQSPACSWGVRRGHCQSRCPESKSPTATVSSQKAALSRMGFFPFILKKLKSTLEKMNLGGNVLCNWLHKRFMSLTSYILNQLQSFILLSPWP